MKNAKQTDVTLILISVAALFLGSLVYFTDRPPDHTYFISMIKIDLSLLPIPPNLFGPVGNSLPSFIHVFSLILMTAGLVSYQKRACFIICLFWFLVDCLFELGQGFDILISNMIPDWFSGILFLEKTRGYFLNGTFDFIDLAAIASGAAAAYFVINHLKKGGKSYEEKK